MGTIIGVNKRNLPNDLMLPYNITVVLVEGQIGDYAAYYGMGSDEWVAAHGNKLSYEEAQVHFCGSLDRKKYRG